MTLGTDRAPWSDNCGCVFGNPNRSDLKIGIVGTLAIKWYCQSFGWHEPKKTSSRRSDKVARRQSPKQGSNGDSSSNLNSMNRRFLLRSGAAVGALVLAGGWIHAYDTQNRVLHDLSTVGSGHPVVLQVHDPSCAMCRQLKRSTETALERFPDIKYRIADLSSREGSAFAAKYTAGKVTLLLFDSAGELVGRVQGVTPSEKLEDTFSRYLKLDKS